MIRQQTVTIRQEYVNVNSHFNKKARQLNIDGLESIETSSLTNLLRSSLFNI